MPYFKFPQVNRDLSTITSNRFKMTKSSESWCNMHIGTNMRLTSNLGVDFSLSSTDGFIHGLDFTLDGICIPHLWSLGTQCLIAVVASPT